MTDVRKSRFGLHNWLNKRCEYLRVFWHSVQRVICPVCGERFGTPTQKNVHFWRACYGMTKRRLAEDPFR